MSEILFSPSAQAGYRALRAKY